MERYNALLDIDTHALLAIGLPPMINFLREAIMGTFPAISVNVPNYPNNFYFLTLIPVNYPEWTWAAGDRKFKKTSAQLLTDDLRTRAALAAAKKSAAAHVMRYVSLSRSLIDRGTAHQDLVYAHKQTEAVRITESGSRTINPSEYPFVAGYASASGITLAQAAEKILEAAKKDIEYLAKTETLRVHYLEKIKNAQTADDAHAIVLDFNKESFYGGLLAQI